MTAYPRVALAGVRTALDSATSTLAADISFSYCCGGKCCVTKLENA